jgi:predicted dienelactone hydrolase
MTIRPWLQRMAATLLAAGVLPVAAQVGLQRLPLDQGRMPALLWYPTAAPAQARAMGPFTVTALPGAQPSPGRHPLVLISHGTGGNELGHAWLAQSLVAAGYLVLSVRHPGDNFQDRSGVNDASYFAERPRQLSRALDELLADARWAALIDAERVAAVGHSAGGHTVLALAGGRPDPARWLAHCSSAGAGPREDKALCALGGIGAVRPAAGPSPASPSVQDTRVRAVVVTAPMILGLEPSSLAAVQRPVHIEASGRDEVLAPVHHGQALCRTMPQATCVTTPEAGHFASFHPVQGPLGPPGADPAFDPAGFDRAAWQAAAAGRIKGFLAAALK